MTTVHDPAAALLEQARRAAALRAHATDPDVVALVVDRTRVAIERIMWTGIVLGLLFTMGNVQQLAAGNAAPWSSVWLFAWLLAPLVELPLLGLLLGEQLLGRYGIRPGRWVRRTRWTLLAFTYAMNTWTGWTGLATGTPGAARDLLLHSVPPLAVLLAAEALTDLRQGMHEAIAAAARQATARRQTRTPRPAPNLLPAAPKLAAPAPKLAAPAPKLAAPAPNVAAPAENLPTSDARSARAVGVEWAVDNWSESLTPAQIGEAMARLGRPVSKSERSKIRKDAAAVVAQRARDAARATPRHPPADPADPADRTPDHAGDREPIGASA